MPVEDEITDDTLTMTFKLQREDLDEYLREALQKDGRENNAFQLSDRHWERAAEWIKDYLKESYFDLLRNDHLLNMQEHLEENIREGEEQEEK